MIIDMVHSGCEVGVAHALSSARVIGVMQMVNKKNNGPFSTQGE